MTDSHDEHGAPDVDYEAEDDAAKILRKGASLNDNNDVSKTTDSPASPSRIGAGAARKPVAASGKGNSETEGEEEGEIGRTHPHLSITRDQKLSVGDSDTESSSLEEGSTDGRELRQHCYQGKQGEFKSTEKDVTEITLPKILPKISEKVTPRGYNHMPSVSGTKSGQPSQTAESNGSKTPTINIFTEENVGVYIPPAKRRMLELERKMNFQESNHKLTDAVDNLSSNSPITPIHIQRQSWENLKRSINGTINRLSSVTIKPLIHSLFREANLLRGRGILARSLLRASQASPQYAPTYAALMAVINTKLPECGELLLTRAVLAFRRGYKTRDRNVVSSTLALLGHLFNQGMAHELLSLQILTVLLDGDPTEDSVDVAVGYMCVVGRQLTEVSPAGVHAVMERFRGLLHDGSIGRKSQYRIESLLKIKKDKFIDYPTIPDEDHLDLVEREDQIMFDIGLDDEGLKKEEGLDVFHFDENFDAKEEEWLRVRAEILGEDDNSSNDDSGSGSWRHNQVESEDEVEIHNQKCIAAGAQDEKKTVIIQDLTETDLVHLRRTIYLTIMSSATFEECTHKLAKMDIPQGRESELINMIIECCSQERTFLRYYGLVSGRFCLLHERWQNAFETAFSSQYNTIHRLETNKLRNVAKLFGHLLHTDSISWSVFSVIHLNEDETTSSSRIFIKILVQEMTEAMGMATMKIRFDTDNSDPDGEIVVADTSGSIVTKGNDNGKQVSTTLREFFKGMFPKDNARNTRYAINFFTSIGLGPLTDGMREFLKNAPKLILAQAQNAAARKGNNSDSSSVLSSSSSSTSSFYSSTSRSYSSSSSYTSSSSQSSYSSYSRDRNRKSKVRKEKLRKEQYSSQSYSNDSSDSLTSSSSQFSHDRKKHNSKLKRDDKKDQADFQESASHKKRNSVQEDLDDRSSKSGKRSASASRACRKRSRFERSSSGENSVGKHKNNSRSISRLQ